MHGHTASSLACTTFVTLLLIPVNYLVLEDIIGPARKLLEQDEKDE